MAVNKKQNANEKNKNAPNVLVKSKKIVFEENLEDESFGTDGESHVKDEIEKRWYELYDGYNTVGEIVELKDSELSDLRNLCRNAYDCEYKNQMKNNPSDAKWLETALEKGTSRDRANAGALLVQTNPLCNLNALESLIGLTKLLNKGHLDAIQIIAELMLNSIMPMDRKLIPLTLRGADWKNIKKLELEKSLRDKIFAYWHFEEALRELYFQFLNNLSHIVQNGKDQSKEKVINHASKLFMMIPEKEAYLLSLLVNKLGDPKKQIAATTLSRLTSVVRKHPAMSSILVIETEKLLFRNNISQHAQHYALAYLSQVPKYGDYECCQRMINICFDFFKILTGKGEVNSKTMQCILACLRKSIGHVKRDTDIADLVKPEVLNTVFRLVHLADVQIAFQALSLLLEITETAGESQNRFYNALYKKLLDPNLANVGPKISAIFFYIIHRAIQNDPKNDRAQAFIKRLLQVSFNFPPAKVCGVLIVVHKILKKRKFLSLDGVQAENKEEVVKTEKRPDKYDAFNRNSEFAGAKFTMKYELVRFLSYFHPTVRNFAESILNGQSLTYYGDPIKDFSIGQFLDRFAFKNPKKPKTENDDGGKKADGTIIKKKDYIAAGARGKSVHLLTKDNCTEDEKYIFEFLEQKREKLKQVKDKNDSDDPDVQGVDDDEFEKYLDGLGVAGGKEDDVDYMTEFEKDAARNKDKKAKDKKKKSTEESDDEDIDDWADDDDDDDIEDDELVGGEDDFDSDEEGSISLDEDFSGSEDDDEDSEPKSKKARKDVSDRDFQKKLKTTDMNSLFTAVDDFSEILEKNSKDKSHGTLGEIFNQDKSSEKQLSWEKARMLSKGSQHSRKKFIPKKHGQSSKSTGQTFKKNNKKFSKPMNKGGKKTKFSGKRRK